MDNGLGFLRPPVETVWLVNETVLDGMNVK